MSDNKKTITAGRKQAVIWIIALLPVVLVAAVYRKLPPQIPTNWGVDGTVSYGGKSNMWVIAGMAPFLAGVLQVLPYIDPKKRNYRKFLEVYQSFRLFMQVFMLVVVGIILTESFWPGTIEVSTVITAMCGILFMLLGNMMPKFRQNFFCGFRTPWALANEAVWNKTHRLGGKLMFGAGILGFLGAFLPWERAKFVMLFVPVMAATTIPYVMSYVWFRRLGTDEEKGE